MLANKYQCKNYTLSDIIGTAFFFLKSAGKLR